MLKCKWKPLKRVIRINGEKVTQTKWGGIPAPTQPRPALPYPLVSYDDDVNMQRKSGAFVS